MWQQQQNSKKDQKRTFGRCLSINLPPSYDDVTLINDPCKSFFPGLQPGHRRSRWRKRRPFWNIFSFNIQIFIWSLHWTSEPCENLVPSQLGIGFFGFLRELFQGKTWKFDHFWTSPWIDSSLLILKKDEFYLSRQEEMPLKMKRRRKMFLNGTRWAAILPFSSTFFYRIFPLFLFVCFFFGKSIKNPEKVWKIMAIFTTDDRGQ